ncbi:chymotrypsin-like [Chironomus tepperi]|uniref:chymotrypsin-like n=1 Tax=Chironomus tepperi TaxID=113505 RepID=UPI00391F4713
MKQQIFFIFLIPFVLSQRLTDEDAEAFRDPIELPIYQEAIKNMFPNYTGDRRIIGGEIAQLGQFPYSVVLHMRSGSTWFICGGALIRFNWVLSAAHCVVGFNSIQVIVGAVNRIFGPAAFNVTVTEREDMIFHPYFEMRTFMNNIGLIRLRTATPALLDHPFVGLIRLPNVTDARIDLTGRASNFSGFGSTGLDTEFSEVLQFITVPVISNQECSDAIRGSIFAFNLCVSTVGGRSPCHGDSGGALTNEIDRNRTVVIGIMSFSAIDCSIGVPAVFTRVTSYLAWIESHVNSGYNLRFKTSLGILMLIPILMSNFGL